MDCRWNFSSNAVIELVFFSFRTESSADFVSVYDGGSLSSPLIRKMSGSSVPPPITSSSINLYVKFSSDGTNTYDGFVAAYRGKARHKVTQDGFDNSKLPCPRQCRSRVKIIGGAYHERQSHEVLGSPGECSSGKFLYRGSLK